MFEAQFLARQCLSRALTPLRHSRSSSLCHLVVVCILVHQYHAPAIALDLDFVQDHHHHRVHLRFTFRQLFRFLTLLLLFLALLPKLSREKLFSLLLVVAFVLFFTCPFTSSSAIPTLRESSPQSSSYHSRHLPQITSLSPSTSFLDRFLLLSLSSRMSCSRPLSHATLSFSQSFFTCREAAFVTFLSGASFRATSRTVLQFLLFLSIVTRTEHESTQARARNSV